MIDCVFIQTSEPTLEGYKFIYTFQTVFIIGIEFRHPNFSIKEGIVHLVSLLSYCYATKKFTNLLLVKMKGNISKEMAENMKRRESLESKLGGSQVALEFDREEKNRLKMVVTIFDRRKIIFSEMEKFQRWIINRDFEWA